MIYNKQNNFQKKTNKQFEFKGKKNGTFKNDKNNNFKDNKNNFSKSENYFSKDRDDIYTPKVYPKKKKTHNFFDGMILPEFDDKQRMRNKREMDRKYKSRGM